MSTWEPKYSVPHSFDHGNSSRCDHCRYFRENERQKEQSPYHYTGECHSKAAEADRSHIFTRRTNNNDYCRWWFPIGPQAGEQEELI